MNLRPEMANHPLAQAAREVNAYAEDHGVAETCAHYGLQPDDVQYIADQRALRAIFGFLRGQNVKADHSFEVRLTQTEQVLHVQFTAAYMDGLVIGWRARGIRDLEVVKNLGKEEC